MPGFLKSTSKYVAQFFSLDKLDRHQWVVQHDSLSDPSRGLPSGFGFRVQLGKWGHPVLNKARGGKWGPLPGTPRLLQQ